MVENSRERPDDKNIGERVKAARGGTAQNAVANEMKALGHRWSQATVWAVEKGERSLKMAEGRDLAMVLGVSVLDLLEDKAGSDAYVWIRREVSELNRSCDRLLESLIEWAARRQRVYLAGKTLSDPDVIEQIPESKRATLKRDVIDAANFTLKDIAEHIVSKDWDTARLEELDGAEASPIELGDDIEIRFLQDDSRQLPDPENEVRYQEMLEKIQKKRETRESRNGLDSEA